MPFIKSEVHNILVISLSNIGDVLLTFPVIDILRRDFPQERISLVVGPKAASLFSNNSHFKKVYIFDKRQSAPKTLSWIFEMRKEVFDLVVDLRHTLIPYMIKSRWKTPISYKKEKNIHKRVQHLHRLKTVYPYQDEAASRATLFIPNEDRKVIDDFVKKEIEGFRFVVIGAGAADHRKRWHEQGFAELCDHLANTYRLKFVLIGDQNDHDVAKKILNMMKTQAINLCGRLTLIQLAALMERAVMVIVNDSAPMHMASYLNKPVLAIFGPSDPSLYGPWSDRCKFLRSPKYANASCVSSAQGGITDISTSDILNAFQITDKGVIFS